MEENIERVLVDQPEITAVIRDIAAKINKDYQGKQLLLIGILKGCVSFMAELMKYITVPCVIDFMVVSSYGKSNESSGRIDIEKDVSASVAGMDVLIVEDIVDSGITLSFILEHFANKGCSSLEIAALLDKPGRRKTQIPVKYCGKQIEDCFVVGFGLDYAEYYRNLPYIGVLRESV